VAGISSDSFEERKNKILTAVDKTSGFLESTYLADEKKLPWEISRATQIRELTENAIDEIKDFISSLADQSGSLL
jgi:hypothetical protein